jgi:hypothetical protein
MMAGTSVIQVTRELYLVNCSKAKLLDGAQASTARLMGSCSEEFSVRERFDSFRRIIVQAHQQKCLDSGQIHNSKSEQE